MASINFLEMIISISFNVELRTVFTIRIVRSTIARSALSRTLNQTLFRKALRFRDINFTGVNIAFILRGFFRFLRVLYLRHMKSNYESILFRIRIPNLNSTLMPFNILVRCLRMGIPSRSPLISGYHPFFIDLTM